MFNTGKLSIDDCRASVKSWKPIFDLSCECEFVVCIEFEADNKLLL